MKLLISIFITLSLFANEQNTPQATYFTNLNKVTTSIVFDIRYATSNNFIGRPIKGYARPLCLLTNQSASALLKVEKQLQKKGLRLKVFDCYRPQRAVNHFVRWAKDLNDTKMKKSYYPNVPKKVLFKEGYIAAKSGHSRGSTLDLSIAGLDMGSPFDYFDPLSHTMSEEITSKQHRNRMYLKRIMETHGFKNYAEEWWHYTLKDEPFKTTYFDFEIR